MAFLKKDPSPAALINTAGLGLGCLWLWRLSAINQTTRAFGIETPFDNAYKLVIEATFAALFIAFAFFGRRSKSRQRTVTTVAGGCLSAYGGYGLLAYSAGASVSPAIWVSAALEGLSLALLFRAWMESNLNWSPQSLGTILAGSSAGALIALLSSNYLPSSVPITLVLVSPILGSAAILAMNRCRSKIPSSENRPPKRVALADIGLSASLLALVFSSNLIDGHYIIPPSASGVYCAAVVALLLIAYFATCHPSTGRLFVLIAAFMLALVSVGLFFPDRTEVFKGLSFTAFCLVNVYAFGWALRRDSACGCSLKFASAFIAAMALSSLLAHFCILLLDVPTVFALSAILIALAFGSLVASLAPHRKADEASLKAQQETDPFPAKTSLFETVEHPQSIDEDINSTNPESTIDPLEKQCQRISSEYQLTAREEELLVLLAHGHTLKAIAERLSVSDNTAKYHRRSIYQKLGISSKQELLDMVNKRP